jgi:hypothetical protein
MIGPLRVGQKRIITLNAFSEEIHKFLHHVKVETHAPHIT